MCLWGSLTPSLVLPKLAGIISGASFIVALASLWAQLLALNSFDLSGGHPSPLTPMKQGVAGGGDVQQVFCSSVADVGTGARPLYTPGN